MPPQKTLYKSLQMAPLCGVWWLTCQPALHCYTPHMGNLVQPRLGLHRLVAGTAPLATDAAGVKRAPRLNPELAVLIDESAALRHQLDALQNLTHGLPPCLERCGLDIG